MLLKIGISSCLLGEKVRYDGEQRLDVCLRDSLGKIVEWVSVCPEVECGFGVPREKVHLIGDPNAPRFVTIESNEDLTDKMNSWIGGKLDALEEEDLCGFIFKKKSPSCSGHDGVKVFLDDEVSFQLGMGLFAKAFVECFPSVPVEDEDRLHDDEIREEFLKSVMVYQCMQRVGEFLEE